MITTVIAILLIAAALLAIPTTSAVRFYRTQRVRRSPEWQEARKLDWILHRELPSTCEVVGHEWDFSDPDKDDSEVYCQWCSTTYHRWVHYPRMLTRS